MNNIILFLVLLCVLYTLFSLIFFSTIFLISFYDWFIDKFRSIYWGEYYRGNPYYEPNIGVNNG